MKSVVAILALVLLLALSSLELIAARGMPDARVPGSATADSVPTETYPAAW